MGIFRLPKTIRWILFSAILLLLLLTVYRYLLYLLFPNIFGGIKSGLGKAFWYGFRFDGRITGIFTLLVFLLSFYPGKHFFRAEEGKKVALWFCGFLLAGILIIYMADIAYLRNFNQRLNGSIISDVAKNTNKGMVYKSKTEWLPITAIMITVMVLYLYLLHKMHDVIRELKVTASGGKRTMWQILLVLVCLVGIYGNLGLLPITVKSVAEKLNTPQVLLALNPFEALLSTLPERR